MSQRTVQKLVASLMLFTSACAKTAIRIDPDTGAVNEGLTLEVLLAEPPKPKTKRRLWFHVRNTSAKTYVMCCEFYSFMLIQPSLRRTLLEKPQLTFTDALMTNV